LQDGSAQLIIHLAIWKKVGWGSACSQSEEGVIHRSDDHRAVTCTLCMMTDEFCRQRQEAMSQKIEPQAGQSVFAPVIGLQNMMDRKGFIQTIIHLMVPADMGYRTVCMDEAGSQRSDDPRAVTCLMCKNTDVFKERLQQIRTTKRIR